MHTQDTGLQEEPIYIQVPINRLYLLVYKMAAACSHIFLWRSLPEEVRRSPHFCHFSECAKQKCSKGHSYKGIRAAVYWNIGTWWLEC